MVERITEVHWLTLAIGALAIVVIKLMKKYTPKIPSALMVVIIGTALVYIFNLDAVGVGIVGEIPSGFPSFSIPSFSLEQFTDLLPMSLTIAVIAFMEAISVAKSIEEKHDYYQVHPSQELVALGMSNIIGSFFQSYPTTGGFSRTAVSNQAGAKTGMYGIIAAFIVALTLLFLTPLFYYLPKAVLSAIIMVAVFGLIDFKLPRTLWKHHKDEFLLLLITFVTTLTVSIVIGIVTGIVFSLLLFIYRAVKPHFAELKKIQGEEVYRNVNRYNSFEDKDSGILIFRFDSQIFFANKDYFKENLINALHNEAYSKLILDMKGVNYIDSSGMLTLVALFDELKKKDIDFYFANTIGPVRDLFEKDYVSEINFKQRSAHTVKEAVELAKKV